jgi:hypothetical protein
MKTQFFTIGTTLMVLLCALPTDAFSQSDVAQRPAAEPFGQSQYQTQRIGPESAPQVSEVFRFKPYEFATHPLYEAITAFWQHNPGASLDIGLPFGSPLRFDLSRFPMDRWVDLQDASGKQIPLSIFVNSRGPLFGKWLE